jgi:RhtB (resistance to homoserine/threonine) family protein
MFGTQDLPLFIVTAFVLYATPGVDMLFTLSRTLQHGWRTGMAAALGITAGCVVHTLAAALGLATLLATSALAFTAIKWLGAAYLLWLAWGMLRASVHDSAPSIEVSARVAATRVFAQGFLTNVLNPKVALFFLALLPQFISVEAPDKTVSFLFLGAVFVAGGAVFLFALVVLAHRMRAFGATRITRRVLNAIGGALFAAVAVRLVQAER